MKKLNNGTSTEQIEALEEAIQIAGEEDAFWEENKGKRMRVVRSVVMEGDAEWMRRQLANSLPLGERFVTYGRGKHVPGAPMSTDYQAVCKVLLKRDYTRLWNEQHGGENA